MGWPPPKAPFLLLRVYLLAVLLILLRRFVPIPKLVRFFSGPRARFFYSCPDRHAHRLRPYVNFVLGHGPLRMNDKACLVRSLILFCFLKPRLPGLQIVSGVTRKAGGGFDGHCWLELGGQSYDENEKDLEKFERLLVYG